MKRNVKDYFLMMIIPKSIILPVFIRSSPHRTKPILQKLLFINPLSINELYLYHYGILN